MRGDVFGDLDRMDATAWAAHLAPDAVMRCGSAAPVHGRESCRLALVRLYEQIQGVEHQIIEQWEHGGATISEANVLVTGRDGREREVPVVTIFRTNGQQLISDYRIYTDLSRVRA